MSFSGKILFYIITSFCLATAQCLFSLYAKGIPSPFSVSQWFAYSISNHHLYGGILLYGISFVLFIFLLRIIPVAQVVLTTVTIVTIIVFIYNYMYGEELSLVQYLGAFMATGGLIALNWKA